MAEMEADQVQALGRGLFSGTGVKDDEIGEGRMIRGAGVGGGWYDSDADGEGASPHANTGVEQGQTGRVDQRGLLRYALRLVKEMHRRLGWKLRREPFRPSIRGLRECLKIDLDQRPRVLFQ